MAPKLRTHGALAVAALVLVAPSGTAYAYDALPATQTTEDHRGPDGASRDASGDDGADGDEGRGYEGGGREDGGHEDGRGEGRRDEGGSGEFDGRFVGHAGGPRRYVGTGTSGTPSGPERPAGHDPRPDARHGHDDSGYEGTALDAYRDPARSWAWVWDGRDPAAKPASPKPLPSASPSLAGRQAGEGRMRPGRTSAPSPSTPDPDPEHDPESDHDQARDPDSESASASPERNPDDADDTDDTEHTEDTDAALHPASPPAPAHTAQAADGRGGTRPVAAPLERQGPVLTLGAGCALMGLGLGYMGLRLRRR